MSKTAATIARELREAALGPEPPPVPRIVLLDVAAILDPGPLRGRRRKPTHGAGIVITYDAPPAPPSFGPGHLAEAYELGRDHGRRGR